MNYDELIDLKINDMRENGKEAERQKRGVNIELMIRDE